MVNLPEARIFSDRLILTGTKQRALHYVMKTKLLGLSVALSLLTAGACFARENANMGTWKLNEAKSTLDPGQGKNHTVIYEPAGDSVKVTVIGSDKDGKPTRSEWTGKFDGKDYEVTGDGTHDTRAYKEVNDHTLDMTMKSEGKVIMTGRIMVSKDGKSRVVTTGRTNEKGQQVQVKAIYDKE